MLTMKANEVMNLLGITRKTFQVYIYNSKIRFTVMSNGHYCYNDEDVYKLFNRNIKRKIMLYAMALTAKQKSDINNQIEQFKQWCFTSGYTIINGKYLGNATGISFENRKGVF